MVQSPGLNQVLTLSGVLFCSISDGFIFGQMSGMLADLQSKNSAVQPRLEKDDVSWIGASVHVTAVCGFAIATAVTEVLGRRRAIIILSVPIICTWIAMFFATDKTTLLITRLVIGASFGGVLQLSFIVTGEYFSPNVRSLYLNLISSVGPSIGTALGHVLGILLHWRTVALIGIIPTGLSALLPCLWQESPSWLASKGKFDECEKAFRALHVQNVSSERELELLIDSEKNKRTIREKEKRQNIVALLRRKDLHNVTEFGFMISVFRVAAGKILFSTYAITILQDLTTEDDILLVTLLVDGFAILGSCLSCLFVSRMRVRTLFLSTAAAANVILFVLSICIYVGPKNVFFSWFIAVLLALYFITVNCGPYPVVEALIGEIYPLDLKTYCFFIFGCMSAVSMFLSTNLAASMFATIGYHGVFFVNACIMLLCYFYFWVKMPETKGRTLQEIEYFFKYKTFEGLHNREQNRTLIKRLNE